MMSEPLLSGPRTTAAGRLVSVPKRPACVRARGPGLGILGLACALMMLGSAGITGNAAEEAPVPDATQLAEAMLKEEPLPPADGSIPVKIGVKLDQIVSIDQRAENFSAVVAILVRYRDPALAYEPTPGEPGFRMYRLESMYKLIEESRTQWPELILLNQQGRRDLVSRAVALTPGGTLIALTRFTATFQAPDFDFRRFPFDHQQFFIRAALALPEAQFHLVPLAGASGIGQQLGEEEWVIHEDKVFTQTTTQITGLPSSEFVLAFKAHRHLLYYVMRIFLPMLVILTVTWFTFLLKDYVKRIDIGITTLLLFIAFNFAVSSDLPRLGYVTLMDALMTVAFVITGVVLMVNVSLRRLQNQGHEARAARLDQFAIWGYWPAYGLGSALALLLI